MCIYCVCHADVTQSYVQHHIWMSRHESILSHGDSFKCATLLYTHNDLFICNVAHMIESCQRDRHNKLAHSQALWLIHVCTVTVITLTHVSHVAIWFSHEDSFISATWLTYMCDITHTSLLYVKESTWPNHMCNMTHLYVQHYSCICATWLVHMCDMTRPCICEIQEHATNRHIVWHDSFSCVTWRIHMCDITHSYVRHDAFISSAWINCRRDTTRVTWLVPFCRILSL